MAVSEFLLYSSAFSVVLLEDWAVGVHVWRARVHWPAPLAHLSGSPHVLIEERRDRVLGRRRRHAPANPSKDDCRSDLTRSRVREGVCRGVVYPMLELGDGDGAWGWFFKKRHSVLGDSTRPGTGNAGARRPPRRLAEAADGNIRA